jgi:thiamine biosynthesis lipoprotein
MGNRIHRCKPYLGTFVEVDLRASLSVNELLAHSETVFHEIERLHNLLSFHKPSSELSKLNRRLLDADDNLQCGVDLGEELTVLIEFSLHLWQLSGGLYDVTVAPSLVKQGQLPNHLGLSSCRFGNSQHLRLVKSRLFASKSCCIDLGGIAKGFAVDKACKTLPTGVRYNINAGGDLTSNDWKTSTVQLKYARRSSALKNQIMLNSCVATSGNYYRAGHSAFISPTSGVQVKYKGSVSVFANSVMVADALTKVAALASQQEYQIIADMFDAKTIRLSRFGFVRNTHVAH